MNLKETLSSVLSVQPSRCAVRDLVTLYHRIAVVYLTRKARAGGFNPDFFGLSLEDVAVDCIADLFSRNDRGGFAQLEAYYTAVDYGNLDEEQLLGASRRLVFSKVNQGLYRQYKEADPSLHKILRNLKAAVAASPCVHLDCHYDEWWIVIGSFDATTSPLPVIPPEILESHVTELLAEHRRLRDLLRAVGRVFEDQALYQSAYPLLGFARILCSAFSTIGMPGEEVPVEEPLLSREEIGRRIHASVECVKARMLPSYVGRGKIHEQLYTAYFRAIAGILHAEYGREEGIGLSYFDHFQAEQPHLTKEIYRREHRTQLEYLTKLTRQHFLAQIRREL